MTTRHSRNTRACRTLYASSRPLRPRIIPPRPPSLPCARRCNRCLVPCLRVRHAVRARATRMRPCLAASHAFIRVRGPHDPFLCRRFIQLPFVFLFCFRRSVASQTCPSGQSLSHPMSICSRPSYFLSSSSHFIIFALNRSLLTVSFRNTLNSGIETHRRTTRLAATTAQAAAVLLSDSVRFLSFILLFIFIRSMQLRASSSGVGLVCPMLSSITRLSPLFGHTKDSLNTVCDFCP